MKRIGGILCLVVLAFVFCQIDFTVPKVLADMPASPYLVSHVVALYPPPVDPNVQTTVFNAGDLVMSFVHFLNLPGGEAIQWNWYGPNGFHSITNIIGVAGESYCCSYFRSGIPNISGAWSVTFSLNGQILFTDNFIVVGSQYKTYYQEQFFYREGA